MYQRGTGRRNRHQRPERGVAPDPVHHPRRPGADPRGPDRVRRGSVRRRHPRPRIAPAEPGSGGFFGRGRSRIRQSFGGGPADAPPHRLLTSSDRRDQRLEAVGTGLSGRNEFYRQLQRLRAAHPVAVVATATGAASTAVAGGGTDNIVTPWSKMVTARVGLERREATAAPAGEKSGGYEYKALVPCAAGTTATPAGGAGGGSFVATVPFKIDSSGIWD